VSIASISEKQIAAMNFSQESKLQFNEEPENIVPKYVQMPEPKHPIITNPETTNPTYAARPNSLIFDSFNLYNKNNDENTTSSSSTSSVPSTPIVQPTPPVYTSPFDSKSLSRFSIGVSDNDNIFLRDEKVVEIHHPEVIMESKVEKSVLNQNFNNQLKNQEEKSNESQNATNDIKKSLSNEKDNEKKGDEKNNDDKKDNEKKDNEKKVNEKKDNEKKVNEKKDNEIKVNEKKDNEIKVNEKKVDEKKDNDEKKDIKKKNDEKKDGEKKVNDKKDSEKKSNDSEKKGSEKKDNETSIKLQNPEKKHSTLDDNIVHNRDSVSDDSNTTLNDVKKKSNEELKNETKKIASISEKSNEINESTKLTPRTINKFEEKETNKNINVDDSIYKSMNQSIPVEIQFKNNEIILNNSPSLRSSLQISKQPRYSRDDDYREEYLREDTELYNNEIRINEMNRYPNREIIYRDESLVYNNPGERMRYNDNYHRTQQYVDDDYESYDYTPSQNRGSYVTREGSPPRANLSYSQRPYSNSVPMPTAARSSSVREMTNRFQLMNEERRTVSL
jgi:hypothetical protein